MADGGVRVEGLKETVRNLQALGVEVTDLKAAFGAIAERAAGLAASFAPHRTGKLAASIKGSNAKNYATVRAGGARVPWAGPINFGWPKRGLKANRFMQRADDAIRPDIESDLVSALDKLIADRGLS